MVLRLGEGEEVLLAQAEAQAVLENVPAACAPPEAVTEPDLEGESVAVPLPLGETSTEGLATQGE